MLRWVKKHLTLFLFCNGSVWDEGVLALLKLVKFAVAVAVLGISLAGCSQNDMELSTAGVSKTSAGGSSAEAITTARVEAPAESLSLSEIVYFDFDSAELSPSARTTLDQVVRIMSANPTESLEIGGHADERGTRSYNLALGARRAASVADYLLAQGINELRLRQISYGKEKPLLSGSNEEAWQKNRRAELNGE